MIRPRRGGARQPAPVQGGSGTPRRSCPTAPFWSSVGKPTGFSPLNMAERYDPATEHWATVATTLQ